MKRKKTVAKISSMEPETQKVSLEEQIKRDKIQRVTRTKEAIESALANNNCRLACSMVIGENGNTPIIDVVAVEPSQ